MTAPKLVVRVHDGRTVLTRVTLNGVDIQATRVRFDSGESIDGLVTVHIECIADLDIEMTGDQTVYNYPPRTATI